MDNKDDLQTRKLILWHLRRISELTNDYEVKKSVMQLFSEIAELKEVKEEEGIEEEVEEEKVYGPKCPKCNGTLVIKSSGSGFYAYCTTCNRTFNLNECEEN
jgi:ssDNA-binding Zn-finger/Zn-ribbon topoisomerase 1